MPSTPSTAFHFQAPQEPHGVEEPHRAPARSGASCQKGTNVVLIGNPGVGKTFLAKVIGWRACQANQRVLFTTAMDMLNHLLASQVDHSLVRKLKTLHRTRAAHCATNSVIYRSISKRPTSSIRSSPRAIQQKRSSIITTNTPFSDWGNILFNTTIATAIADRLVENSEIFLLGGDSLRKANKNSPLRRQSSSTPAPIRRRTVRYPARRSPPGEPLNGAANGCGGLAGSSAPASHNVQLQRQSSVPALADGIPRRARCSCSRTTRHAARLPAP